MSARLTAIPDGWVLVHNSVRPTRQIGSRGFRIWLDEPDAPRLVSCDCGWAPELGKHFRVQRDASLGATAEV